MTALVEHLGARVASASPTTAAHDCPGRATSRAGGLGHAHDCPGRATGRAGGLGHAHDCRP